MIPSRSIIGLEEASSSSRMLFIVSYIMTTVALTLQIFQGYYLAHLHGNYARLMASLSNPKYILPKPFSAELFANRSMQVRLWNSSGMAEQMDSSEIAAEY